MKRFLKYITIIGCILILVGIGVATAAFSLGANPLRMFDDWEERFDGAPYETFEMEFDEVNRLEINIKGGTVSMTADEEAEKLTVVTDNGKSEHITLHNLERYKKLELLAKKDEEYLIQIPAEWRLSELDVDCAGGQFEGNEIRTDDAELSVSGGEIQIQQVGGKETSMDCAGGDIEWTGTGELSREIDVDCAGGDITITLDEGVVPDRVGYEFDYAGGTIEFFGVDYDGMGAQKRRTPEGMPQLDLDVAGGTIRIQ